MIKFATLLLFLTRPLRRCRTWKLGKKSPSDIADLLSIQNRLQKLLPNAKKALVSIEAGDGAGSGVIVSGGRLSPNGSSCNRSNR